MGRSLSLSSQRTWTRHGRATKPRVNSLVGGCIADCLQLPEGKKQDVCGGDLATATCMHRSERIGLSRMSYSPPAARFLISVIPTFEETFYFYLKVLGLRPNALLAS